MTNSNSRRHARKVTLDAALSNAIAKAVDARKVAAFTVGAAGVLAGAAFAFGATPAMAAEAGAAPDTKPAAVTAGAGDNAEAGKKDGVKDDAKPEDNKPETKEADKNNQAGEKAQSDTNKEAGEQAKQNASKEEQAKQPVVNADGKTDVTKTETTDLKDTATYSAAGVGQDRAATPASAPKVSSEITISKETKDTLPNMYAWGKSDNVYIEGGQNTSVTFKFAAPGDGYKISNIAIFPSDGNTVANKKSRAYLEYYSAGAEGEHKPYSGTYTFATGNDGSATLTMTSLYREANMAAEKYSANRCIYVYGTDSNGKEVLLYKTNIVRAATLIPPKNAGSIVLKYNEELTAQQIQDKLKAALDAPTEATGKKSIRAQIDAASRSNGVGVRDAKKFTNTPDTAENKVIINDQQAYDANQLATVINKVASKSGEPTTYVTGVNNLKTHLISDLGYKSEVLPLTVARYDTRIDKPIVDEVDITKLTEDQKAEICKKLAQLNHVPQDKVKFNEQGEAVINFDGVDAKDAPKIKLSDLVLKKFKEDQITVPAADKAVFVANPLGYSTAELDRIKTAIYEANKENKDLGLTSKDQISLEYLTGDLTGAGKANQGISNGMAENKITVKIKTDKAVAEFTSDIKASKLTKLPNIREDYDVSWTKDKLDNRNTDEGFSWSADKKTIIYRYDPTKAVAFKSGDVTKLLTATPKTGKEGLRVLNGDEQLGHEGADGKEKKSHVYYVIDSKGEPTGALTLGIMNSGYWKGDIQITGTETNMGDLLAKTDNYKFDDEAQPVELASKGGKIYRARLFVAPYGMETYQHVYTFPDGKNPNNTTKAINVIFVPQTNHKKQQLKDSLAKYTTTKVDGKDVPTQHEYYNASDDKKKAYDDALKEANEALKAAGDTEDSKLSEALKARIDNATIRLDKAREALDGANTNKDGLNTSIDANGKAKEGQQAATGTQATNQFKNVSDPDFKDANGQPDTARNNAAKEAKKAYDEALEKAKTVTADDNATQKAVDEAKAELDKARQALNEFSTNKDELNNAIAQHGKVNTGRDTQGTQTLAKADPTYQNSTPAERDAYDKAVAEADKVSKDPNASQKEVNKAIDDLKKAKDALDKNATDKAPLDAAVQKSFDNPKPDDESKQSVFYKNAKLKTNDEAAKKAVEDYDKALKKAKDVLADKNATKKDVEDAKKALEDAEKALHDGYKSDDNDLTKAIANNVSGYLMPAYFNAFDLSQSKDPADTDKAKQAAKDFKAYNDAYHAAKELKKKFDDAAKNPQTATPPTQKEIDDAKKALEEARQVIDKYATDTSKISAALLHSLAIKASPAYLNASAGAAGSDEAKAKQAYDAALTELQKAFNNEMDKDKDGKGNEIPESVIPDQNIDMTNKDALKKLQAHAKGQPLDRDVTKLLSDLNKAVADLNKFATKTDELLKSVNEDDATKQTPAYKNASLRVFQKADSTDADTEKNNKAKQAVDKYGEALNKAKELLVKVDATQEEVNKAKKDLDDARKALLGDPNDQANVPGFNTDVTKLQKSVGEHGKEKQGETAAATEGTVTSDAYRNASDPHFLTAEGKPDEQKNTQAAADKKAYDEALTKAQELLKKHNDKDTPQDAKPTQKDINDALKNLDDARKKLEDNYKTVTTKLDEEAKKSTAEGATVADTDFEATPEFKNADDKKGEGNKDNDDVKAYKDALKTARKLVKAATSTDPNTKNSERPTQKQVDEALDALKKAKKQIEDNYKTNLDALTAAKDYAGDGFKKTPEYKNAVAKKTAGDQGAIAALGTDGGDTGFDNVLAKIVAKLQDDAWKQKATQKDVNALLKQLQTAQDNIANKFKTDAIKLEREVGDKDQDGNPVTPPFEASVAYKNALEKAKTETGNAATAVDSATKKLEAYNEKLKAAQDLIAQVNSTDPNADPATKPTQKQVDDALDALKKAKQDIDNAFKTNASALKNEADDKDERGNAKQEADKFEKSTEYTNALAKTDADGKKDVQTYKDALQKANALLELFNEDGTPKDNIPAGKQIPSQQEVDDAQKALKEIKEKILKNYVTSPHDLQQEFDKSKDGADDNRGGLFEDTPAFKNAEAAKGEGGKDNTDMAAYKKALEDAKALLDKFDRTTGKPKPGETAPTQKKLDDALKALQDAKSKIEKDYATKKEELQSESNKDADFTKSPEYQNATGTPDAEAYKKALDDANKVLKDPNATQAQVDDALKKLKDAKKKLTDDYGTSKHVLREEHSDYSSFESSPGFINAISNLNANPDDESTKSAIDNYKKALEYAKSVLDDPNATQAQVDAALSRLRDAKDAIARKYATDKKNLKNEHEADSDFENSPEFQNAAGTPEAEAYKKALEDAKKVLDDPNATQAQVDAALRKLREAKDALVNGHKTNKADLQNEADDDPAFRNGISYLIAGSTDAEAYKKALDEARRVLADPNATQAQVDEALRKLREAKQRIIDKFNTRGNGFDGYVPNAGGHEGDGYANNANANAVDKSALQAEINSALNVRGNSAVAQAYKNALAEAKRVLADANATQAQVDAAVKQLRAAKAAFNGFGGSDHHLAKTGAGVGLFAGLAAIFAGFGAAGVASRRRKHSNE